MAQYENLEGWEKLSLGMQLDKWAIRYGNRIAVTDSEEEITYRMAGECGDLVCRKAVGK